MQLLNPLDDTTFPAETAAFTGTAGNTAEWNAGPQGVMVWSTEPCYVAIGEGVTATTDSTPIPAFTPVPFIVPQGTGAPWRVSAVQLTAGGNVYAKPINIR
jgi:hypothetical protein